MLKELPEENTTVYTTTNDCPFPVLGFEWFSFLFLNTQTSEKQCHVNINYTCCDTCCDNCMEMGINITCKVSKADYKTILRQQRKEGRSNADCVFIIHRQIHDNDDVRKFKKHIFNQTHKRIFLK